MKGCITMVTTRITSSTILVNWDKRIHTHALLVYGKNVSQSKNYEVYAKNVSTGAWSLESAVRGFWGKGERIPPKVYQYFMRNPVTTKPRGFENGVTIKFEFGVAKIFDTGKGLLTVSLKDVPRNCVQATLRSYVQHVHSYIRIISEEADLRVFATSLDVQSYTWDIVSLNSTATLFQQRINLPDFCSYSTSRVSTFYDPEYHKGYLQLYIECGMKKNTVCVYHTGKCVIMGIKSIESLQKIETKLGELCSGFEMHQLESILFADIEEVDDCDKSEDECSSLYNDIDDGGYFT